MDATARRLRHFIAVNEYRTSDDIGFTNTWKIWECADRAQRRRILKDGLPVRDQCRIDHAGHCTPSYSTVGIRPATRAEIREAKRDERYYPIEMIQEAR